MEKEFIPYEQALALKELGFDSKEFISHVSVDTDNIFFESNGFCPNSSIWAPTFSQAFRWFREKYELCVWVTSKTVEGKTIYIVHARTIPDTIKNNLIVDVFPYATFKTYEEAELECLKKLIEIVKNK
jgi:hypothetical protein